MIDDSNDKIDVESDQPVDVDKVKVPFIYRIPMWVKALFIKYWFCGVIFFFVNMGLANIIYGEKSVPFSQGAYILMLLDGLIYGLAYFLIQGFVIELCERVDGEGRPWLIYYSRKWWTIWIDVVYGLVWAVCTDLIAWNITAAIGTTSAQASFYWVFAEPLSYGVLGLAVEMFFIGLKNLIVFIHRKLTVRGEY